VGRPDIYLENAWIGKARSEWASIVGVVGAVILLRGPRRWIGVLPAGVMRLPRRAPNFVQFGQMLICSVDILSALSGAGWFSGSLWKRSGCHLLISRR
jgi:hypothetical protein